MKMKLNVILINELKKKNHVTPYPIILHFDKKPTYLELTPKN